MGHVFVDAELSWKRTAKLRMLVDTGATHTVLPEELARHLGIAKSPRRLRVQLADGRTKTMHLGTVLLRVAGREAGDTVLIGSRGSEPLLGVEALESLGLAVDARSGKLKRTRAHGVLLVGVRTPATRAAADPSDGPLAADRPRREAAPSDLEEAATQLDHAAPDLVPFPRARHTKALPSVGWPANGIS